MNKKDKASTGGISRRDFLKDAGLLVGGVALGSTALATSCPAGTLATEPSPTAEITVYDVSGAHEIVSVFAARLGDLNGKRVAGLAADPTKWQTHRTFPYIFEQLKSLYPSVNIIPQTEFVMGLGIDDDGVAQAVKEAGADACILGNAA
ncbi:MAG: twin-arginine translocation signal domain-containing protein [Dehalococcoidia bacterium]|nr:twin-arginine translocation signal domain-containing protein [Dehalococcoidia bacterium]